MQYKMTVATASRMRKNKTGPVDQELKKWSTKGWRLIAANTIEALGTIEHYLYWEHD